MWNTTSQIRDLGGRHLGDGPQRPVRRRHQAADGERPVPRPRRREASPGRCGCTARAWPARFDDGNFQRCILLGTRRRHHGRPRDIVAAASPTTPSPTPSSWTRAAGTTCGQADKFEPGTTFGMNDRRRHRRPVQASPTFMTLPISTAATARRRSTCPASAVLSVILAQPEPGRDVRVCRRIENPAWRRTSPASRR